MQIDIALTRGVAIGFGDDPIDLFFFRTTDPGHEMHRSRFAGTSLMRAEPFNTQSDASSATAHYVDATGLPYVIALPTASTWPRELVSVDEVWPRIVGFAASGGASDADFYEDGGGDLAFAAGLTALQGSVGSGDFRVGARYGMGAGLLSACAPSERAQLEVTFQN